MFVDEAKRVMPEEEKGALIAKWEAFDKSLLKDLIMEDGSIRNVDHVEYEKMLALVEKMKPLDYEPSLEPLRDGVSFGLGELDVEELEAVPGPSEKPKKDPVLAYTKQSKLKVSVREDGKKVLGYELPKGDTDEGFVSAGKKRRRK